jgi:hypothetical protein
MSKSDLFANWSHAKKQLDHFKKLELELREQIIAAFPGDLGTNHTETEGYKVTVVRGVTRSVDEAELNILWQQLTDEEKRCISYKPTLDARAFDKLPEGNSLSRAVSIKPSLPTVKLELLEEPGESR